MTTTHDPQTVIDAATAPTLTFREQRVAYWRQEARENWMLGFMDLARRCETFASEWEWEPKP